MDIIRVLLSFSTGLCACHRGMRCVCTDLLPVRPVALGAQSLHACGFGDRGCGCQLVGWPVSEDANVLQATFEDKNFVHIVMELCVGGELFDSIVESGSYTEAKAAACFRKMVDMLHHCHELGVMHRDLKPENFLLTSKSKDKCAANPSCVHVAPSNEDTSAALIASSACLFTSACA